MAAPKPVLSIAERKSELESHLEEGNWARVQDAVSSVNDDDFEMMRRWYSKTGRARARRLSEQHWLRADSLSSQDWVACRQILVATFASTAQEAASSLGLAEWNSIGSGQAHSVVLEALSRRGQEWCAEFIHAVVTASLPRDAPVSLESIGRVIVPLIARFDLPVPEGAVYASAWVDWHTARRSLLLWSAQRPDEPDPVLTTVWFDRAGRAIAKDRPGRDTSLLTILEDDPTVAESLNRALSSAGAMSRLAVSSRNDALRPDWNFGRACAELIARGRLDRDRVVDDALSALARQDTAATHRSIAQLLDAIDLAPEDLRQRMPVVQSAMAVSHGSATAVLLGPAVSAITDIDDLVELSATIFGRKERKQQNDLIAMLTSADAESRFGVEGLSACLREALESADLRIVQKAESKLAAMGSEHETMVEVAPDLWTALPPILRPTAIPPLEASVVGLARLASELEAFQTPTSSARWLATLLAAARIDPSGVRSWFDARDDTSIESDLVRRSTRHVKGMYTDEDVSRIREAIGLLHSGEAVESADLVLPSSTPYSDSTEWWLRSSPTTSVFDRLVQEEVLQRVGTVDVLLSTPSSTDGVVQFGRLLAAMRAQTKAGYAPLDLFQALLRLEAVPTERASELRRMTVARADGGRGRFGMRRNRGRDGAGIVAEWVAGGGAVFPEAEVVDGRLMVPSPVLPVGLDAFPGVPALLASGFDPRVHPPMRTWNAHFWNTIGVLPLWPEYVAALLEPTLFDSKVTVPWIPALVRSGRAGRGVHTVVARAIAFGDQGSRTRGVEATLILIGRGEFDSARFTEACIRLHAAGDLPLARTASSFEQLILSGGFSSTWPTVLALAEVAATAPTRPSGAADIFGLVRRYVAVTPGRVVPPGLVEFARSKGSTKAHVEARAAVEAATDGGRS